MDDAGRGEHAASYGSGSRSESDQTLLRQLLPIWSCVKSDFKLFWWQAEQWFAAAGLLPTVNGLNMDDAQSKHEIVMNKYALLNGKVFYILVRMLGHNNQTEIQKTMTTRILNEFGDDRDGFGLAKYMKAYVNDLTSAEVKLLKHSMEP